ncbi:uncharacterized protein F4822DRAFT_304634 [Hypoxylon trugodes]|uniref:uncharacterized protein n=1 Tax=Hypoxylon trugodes TaxID=326681 RepID=UPI00219084F9|nr:uncharacterized protein F4822DRAFT_304634 [Hypoxylon trugodes]KAI1386065.1 hypothetical protein F4822DRAFT_304634 [Hypoxylon trugodes]
MTSSGARVIVTTHNEDGTSVFHSDNVVEPFSPFGPGGSSFSVFDARSTVPVNNQEGPKDLQKILPRVPPAGVTFCITNMAPHHSAPMHRTLSLDYAVVLSGEIVLGLDDGEEKTVKAGDFIVQQGVNHTWHNRTDEVCRIAFVMVGAEKVKLADGQELEETVFKK